MSQKAINITGWTLTIILSLLFALSAFLKLSQNDTALAQAASFGIDAATYRLLGIVEIIALILFIVPKTGVVGTLLLAAYMGGAIATHLQHQQPIVVPVMIQIVLWITAAIRFPALTQQWRTSKH